MSATNKTTHYELPSFVGSDKPAWLVDWNGAMSAIDSAIYEAKSTADSAATAISGVSGDVSTLEGSVTSLQTTVSTLSDSLTTLIGTVNTITSLIGNGEPTTTDKTIIGAINEINAIITGGSIETSSAHVSYSNTASGLAATTAQGAIDELASMMGESRRIINIGDSYSVDNQQEVDYVQVLRQLTGLSGNNFYNFAAVGSGIVRESTDHHTALELLQSHASDVTNPETITDIIITSGLNDACYITDQTLLAPAVAALMTYIKATYPNARVMYGFIGNIYSMFTDEVKFQRYLNTINIYYDKFEELGAKVMHGVEYICHDALNLTARSSYSHPNDTGHAAIAKFIYECLLFGSSVYKKSYVYTNSDNDSIFVSFDGDTVSIQIRGMGTSHASGTLSGNTAIAQLDDFPVRGMEGVPFIFPAWLWISNEYVPAKGSFKDGTLYFSRYGDGTFNGFWTPTIVMNTLYA